MHFPCVLLYKAQGYSLVFCCIKHNVLPLYSAVLSTMPFPCVLLYKAQCASIVFCCIKHKALPLCVMLYKVQGYSLVFCCIKYNFRLWNLGGYHFRWGILVDFVITIFTLIYFRLATVYLIIAINVSRLLYRALQTCK